MAQTPDAVAAAPVDPPAPKTVEQRNLEAIEKVAAAADKLAAAAERISPPPPAGSAAAPSPDLWNFTVGAGANWVSGNVASVTFAGSAAAIRKGEKTIFTAKVFGGYGEKYNDATDTTPASSDVLLYNAGGTAQFDYRFTKYVSAFVGAGADMDHVKSVEFRAYGDLGVGAVWLDEKVGELQKLYLKTDLSLRVQPEQRFQYYPTMQNEDDVIMIGPRLAANFRYSLTAGTFFTEDIEFMPNVIGAPRFLVNSATKLGVKIAANISVTAGFGLKFDSGADVVHKKSTDTQLQLGLEANF